MVDYIKSKNSALNILEQFGYIEPPVNPVDICNHMGVKVNFVTFNQEHSNISGFYDCKEDAIYVNEEEYPLRQTFTIAHELGHRTLHKDWAESNEYRVLMRNNGYDSDPYELEANEFAGHLLVPRFMLDRYWEQLSRSELSKLFAVSVPTINFRLSREYGV